MNKKLNEIKEHNVRILLNMVLSILTDEQLTKLNEMLDKLRDGEDIEEENAEEIRNYIG